MKQWSIYYNKNCLQAEFGWVFFIQAKDQLVPVEKALDDVATLIKPMKPQLEKLRDLLQDGGQQAEDAQENAEKADKEAAAGSQVKDLLQLLQTDRQALTLIRKREQEPSVSFYLHLSVICKREYK